MRNQSTKCTLLHPCVLWIKENCPRDPCAHFMKCVPVISMLMACVGHSGQCEMCPSHFYADWRLVEATLVSMKCVPVISMLAGGLWRPLWSVWNVSQSFLCWLAACGGHSGQYEMCPSHFYAGWRLVGATLVSVKCVPVISMLAGGLWRPLWSVWNVSQSFLCWLAACGGHSGQYEMCPSHFYAGWRLVEATLVSVKCVPVISMLAGGLWGPLWSVWNVSQSFLCWLAACGGHSGQCEMCPSHFYADWRLVEATLVSMKCVPVISMLAGGLWRPLWSVWNVSQSFLCWLAACGGHSGQCEMCPSHFYAGWRLVGATLVSVKCVPVISMLAGGLWRPLWSVILENSIVDQHIYGTVIGCVEVWRCVGCWPECKCWCRSGSGSGCQSGCGVCGCGCGCGAWICMDGAYS